MLSEEHADLFHHMTAKLLFLCKRSRPDIQTAVAFLCTRVKCPDIDDYKKLARVIKYLRGTSKMPLTLKADSVASAKWWVDASYAVHTDMKSHTGGAMSMGQGMIYGTSTRQRINTKSSTEAELVGFNEVLPQVIWTRNFLAAQGFDNNKATVYQDNQSDILLGKNGRASSSKRTRHINMRYFFITDRVQSKEVEVVYCPTGEMIEDYFTKPLQGSLFKRFRDIIMNVPGSKMLQDHRSVLKHEVTQGVLNNAFTSVSTNGDSSCSTETHVGTVQFSKCNTYQYYDINESVIDGSMSVNDLQDGWTLVQPRRRSRMNKLEAMRIVRCNLKANEAKLII